MPKRVIVIGGGIVGLCSAFYLKQEGLEVTVLDKSDMSGGCSYGNAGFICPSHFVPMAAPGIINQGFKWMLNSRSPFYIRPRLDTSLMKWGLSFMKSATRKHVDASAVPLRDIAFLSKKLYEEWTGIPGFNFNYKPVGLLEFFKTEEMAYHAEETVKAATALGIGAKVLNRQEVREQYPYNNLNILGALYFDCDAQVYPDKLMSDLINWLKNNSVQFETNQEVTGFEKNGDKIKTVYTVSKTFAADHVVLSAGIWSREIAKQFLTNLPMAGGRGYSLTLENSPYKVHSPVILSEARVAISQLDDHKIRFGGTMEITGINARPRMNRVQGILESVKKYFPDFDIPMPAEKDIWYGYRPCSADGLPYIGHTRQYKNVTIATGHSMLGLSLGAATGKLVSELVVDKPGSINIKPFDATRFD